jgi:hypothetical protein
MTYRNNDEFSANAEATTDEQLQYMKSLAKVKEHEIADLRMRIETKTIDERLLQFEVDRQMQALSTVMKIARKHCDRAHMEDVRFRALVDWMEWRNLPWYARLFAKEPVWWYELQQRFDQLDGML